LKNNLKDAWMEGEQQIKASKEALTSLGHSNRLNRVYEIKDDLWDVLKNMDKNQRWTDKVGKSIVNIRDLKRAFKDSKDFLDS